MATVIIMDNHAHIFRGDRWLIVTDRLHLTPAERARLAGHTYEVLKTIA